MSFWIANQAFLIEGTPRRGSKAFHTVHGAAHIKKLEFQDEVSRTLHSLKAIINYGRMSLADLTEVNSDILSNQEEKSFLNLMCE